MSKKATKNMPWRVVGTQVIPNNDLREHTLGKHLAAVDHVLGMIPRR